VRSVAQWRKDLLAEFDAHLTALVAVSPA